MDLKNLSEAATATADPKAKAAKPEPVAKPYEPMVHGESTYDRVTSMLMSVVMGAGIIVGWLYLVYCANSAYAAKVVAPVTIIEVSGGGTADGNPDATGIDQDVKDASVVAATASNSAPENTQAFEEPAPQAMESRALDPNAAADSVGGEVAPETTTAGVGAASGPRARSIGKGGMGIGEGGGPGSGVHKSKRWSFEHPPGQTVEEYKAELDSLGIELGTPSGNSTWVYASHFSSSPVQRTGLASLETRLYASWNSSSRKQYDIELMRSAGIQANANSMIIQLIPKDVENRIGQIEFNYKGRQPAVIRRTRFKIVPKGGKYDFEVISQETLK